MSISEPATDIRQPMRLDETALPCSDSRQRAAVWHGAH
jgi:hypothetical protein